MDLASLSQAWVWMERIILFAIFLQSIEFFSLRKVYGVQGIWRWEILKEDYRSLPSPVRSFFAMTFSDRCFPWLLIIRFLVLLSLCITPYALGWAFLWLSTLLISTRWRGTFNGGSDYMTLIVLFAVALGRSLEDSYPGSMAIALGYVSFQAVASYFFAGLAKIRKSRWRLGEALPGFLASEYYGSPSWVSDLAKKRSRLVMVGLFSLSWGIIIFECAFPLVLLLPQYAAYLIAMALVFHCMNAFVFGLNRFVWAWLATYPAVYWCSQNLS